MSQFCAFQSCKRLLERVLTLPDLCQQLRGRACGCTPNIHVLLHRPEPLCSQAGAGGLGPSQCGRVLVETPDRSLHPLCRMLQAPPPLPW